MKHAQWRTIIVTVAAAYGVAVVAVLAFAYSGLYNVSATDAHWGLTRYVLESARMRSIAAHARGISVPSGLDDPATVQMGVAHFAAHCAVCHGAPGVPPGDIAEGLYPKPPDLAAVAKQSSDAELFWTVKNGIKMTGMPSWGDHSDEELWATVAFVRKLPGISEAEYAKLIMASMTQGGHRHGDMSHPPADAAPGREHQ